MSSEWEYTVESYPPGTHLLIGALMASDSAAHVMTEALRTMVEAWFILAQISPRGSLLERSEQAVEVLEQGITDLRYALNITEEKRVDGH
jgi:hypothetical protein